MNTPERNNVRTPLLASEDSPIFSFLNSLSPIQPIKPLHSLQTFHSLNLSSLQSVFASPHVNQPKESKFSESQSLVDSVDSSKHEKSSLEEMGDSRVPIEFESSSPNHSTTPCFITKPDLIFDLDCTPVEVLHSVLDGRGRRKSSFVAKFELLNKQELLENENEGPECEREELISDYAGKVLVFKSTCDKDVFDESSEPHNACAMQISSSSHLEQGEHIIDNSNKLIFESFDPNCQSETYIPAVKHDEKFIEDKNVQTSQVVSAKCLIQKDDGGLNNEATVQAAHNSKACQIDVSQQPGIRRRCLVFDVSKKKFQNEIELHPERPLGPSGQCSSSDTWVVSSKPHISRPPYTLPSIGLHLNVLATPSNGSSIRLLGAPKSINLLPPITSGQTPQNKLMSDEKDVCPIDGEIIVAEIVGDEASQRPEVPTCEENSSSPKKKRRKPDVGENDSCKSCNCKKSKCLKLYCECFAAGVYCVEPCSCHDCLNKPVHEEIVLSTRKLIESRNPLAFAPKVIIENETKHETGDESNKIQASSRRHKRGCNCKKSNCLKKYCECYQGGVGCSTGCRCRSCKNAFGAKDGTLPSEDENIEHEELGFSEPYNEDGQSLECPSPIIPLQPPRHTANRQTNSSGKPPRALSAPPLNIFKTLTKCRVRLPAKRKLKRNTPPVPSEIAPEDDTPEILRNVALPSNTVKNVSPKQKRVSPPHNAVGLSPPVRNGCRKLILKSTSPFPSLNTNSVDEDARSCSINTTNTPATPQG